MNLIGIKYKGEMVLVEEAILLRPGGNSISFGSLCPESLNSIQPPILFCNG